MFDAAAQTPIGVDLLGDGDTAQGNVGEQGEGMGMEIIFCHQDPQDLVGIRQTNTKPAHFKVSQVSPPGMLESDLIGDLPENTIDQIL